MESNFWKWKAELLSARLSFVMPTMQAMAAEIVRLEAEKDALRRQLADQVMAGERAIAAARAREYREQPKRNRVVLRVAS